MSQYSLVESSAILEAWALLALAGVTKDRQCAEQRRHRRLEAFEQLVPNGSRQQTDPVAEIHGCTFFFS